MSSLPFPCPTRPPVRGSARWLTRPDALGRGQLAIRTEAGVDRLYETADLFDRGVLVGWSLTRLGTGEVYHVDAHAGTCDCPAFTFTAHQRGPCKHLSALKAALLAVGWTGPSAA